MDNRFFRRRSRIGAILQRHSWFSQSIGYLEILSENYLAHGDSLHLANLIQVTRDIFDFYLEERRLDVLTDLSVRAVSRFNIRNTLPELQHEFCDLWNQIHRSGPNFIKSCSIFVVSTSLYMKAPVQLRRHFLLTLEMITFLYTDYHRIPDATFQDIVQIRLLILTKWSSVKKRRGEVTRFLPSHHHPSFKPTRCTVPDDLPTIPHRFYSDQHISFHPFRFGVRGV
ncbi:hypothetical protein B0F90DRAFT_667061 [Multifurca ochricompacta]|uniref:Uncharacterized protein n=1 Tax=Multifurca ochricompacta TaxID=376703 RepID=A0AAD4QGQ9_9AGAM|nr:hypothetical protein B0F90DRAFT_667061 [Multifurca ochricompacta]